MAFSINSHAGEEEKRIQQLETREKNLEEEEEEEVENWSRGTTEL